MTETGRARHPLIGRPKWGLKFASTKEKKMADVKDEKSEVSEQAAGVSEKTVEEEAISKERFTEVTEKLKASEERNTLNEQQMALIAANQNAAAPRAQAKEFDIYKEVGLEDDDDIATFAQQKKINAHFANQSIAQMRELQFRIDHPDFAEVVGTPRQIQTGLYAQPFKDALAKNPALRDVVANSPDPRVAAYAVAKLHKKAPSETVETEDAEKAIEAAANNAKSVKSAANKTGGAALSEEGRYDSMADDEFLALALKNGAII